MEGKWYGITTLKERLFDVVVKWVSKITKINSYSCGLLYLNLWTKCICAGHNDYCLRKKLSSQIKGSIILVMKVAASFTLKTRNIKPVLLEITLLWQSDWEKVKLFYFEWKLLLRTCTMFRSYWFMNLWISVRPFLLRNLTVLLSKWKVSFKRSCGVASLEKWDTKIWYQASWKGSNYYCVEIFKLTFQALTLCLSK